VWVDPDDKVWLSEWAANAIVRFDPNGAPLIVWQSVQLQMVVISGSASASNLT